LIEDHTQTSPNGLNSMFRPGADHHPRKPSDLDVVRMKVFVFSTAG